MTPYQLSVYADVYKDRKKQEEEEKVTIAYLGAYWQRVKKMPSLQEVLGKSKPKKEMSSQDMLKRVKQLNALFGGNEVN